ncbi:MAG: glucose 1-dehydrogenase [candidate division Zixibacteria bacterium]|nr:glucose 1-dehydrogenase [candidate division Zixibacteria bacterium]
MRNFIDLKGKVALITGASRGIGKATAIFFAKTGSDLMLNYFRSEKQAYELSSKVKNEGVHAEIFKANVSSKSQCQKMVDFTLKKFGRIDILINNTGIWKFAPIDRMGQAQLKETLGVNLESVFYLSTLVVPVMKKQKGGNIINISSTAGQRGEANHSHYAATKGAIISLTKSLSTELAPDNIRVNCVAPGWVDTDMSHGSLTGKDKKWILSQIPLGRAAQPEEIAGAILFLASDLATFITGEVINVNGGAVLCG